MKAKRWIWMLAGGVAGYLLLLALLTAAERTNPDASIQSFSDALWYSIVTLSTVGYGDLYPVTTAGKLIGLLFVLLSVGALAFLVGAAVSLLTSRMLPRLGLWMLRKKKWYVFSQMNSTSLALAQSLESDGADGVLLFPLEDKAQSPSGKHFHYYPDTVANAVGRKRDKCAIFFLDEQSGSNYEQALAVLELGHKVYCRTEQTPDHCPDDLTLFNRYECCARDYWRRHPLGSRETQVVIIGDGRYAGELLELGLAVNVFGPEHWVSYHVFGDWADYRCNHPELGLTIGINEDRKDRDTLHFHTESWNADAALLFGAHRIILCDDDDRKNMALLRQLRRYFPVSGQIHLRSKGTIPGEVAFGTDQQIYTAENVMASRLTETARAMHRIYQESSNVAVPNWKDLSEFTRQSNIAAADHLLIKIQMLVEDETITTITAEHCRRAYEKFLQTLETQRDRYRSIEHLRWMRFHSLYNWRYAPVRDNNARLHPLMLPYEALSEEAQAKDEYAWHLLAAMARKIEDMEET